MGEASLPAQATEEFRIDEERHGPDTVLLAIHGDADLHVADELGGRVSQVIDDGASAVVVDLSGVTFLDSMALGILLTGLRRLRARGGRLRVVAPRGEIRRIFEITLLDRVFELDGSRHEALSSARSG
jgi:anti-sigma B factor antagonist